MSAGRAERQPLAGQALGLLGEAGREAAAAAEAVGIQLGSHRAHSFQVRRPLTSNRRKESEGIRGQGHHFPFSLVL